MCIYCGMQVEGLDTTVDKNSVAVKTYTEQQVNEIKINYQKEEKE